MTSVTSVSISNGRETTPRQWGEGGRGCDCSMQAQARQAASCQHYQHCHWVTLSHWHWGTVMLQPEIRGSPLIGKFSKFVLMRRSRSVRLWRVEGYREVSIYYASHHLLDGRDINFLLSCKHFQFILMIHSCRTRYNLDICYSFSVLSFLWKHFPFTIPQLYLPF